MSQLDIGPLRAVALRLYKVGLEYAFTGGSVVNLLLDHPDFAPVRPTDDVDVIIELASNESYDRLESSLRKSGFQHDMREGAPMCRWLLGEIVVDVMPTDGEKLGLNTQWFKEALSDAIVITYAHTPLRVVSPLGLLVTKYLTFSERGNDDYFGSHDLEDFLTVMDGRANIVEEIDEARSDFRNYLIQGVRQLMDSSDFHDALPGHLPADAASQLRVPILRDKLRNIANLALIRT
jgi:hypothetical protein